MAEEIINRKSTCYVTVDPFDKNSDAAAPTAAAYWVHDVESGTEIVAETALTPATSMEIELKGAIVNDMQDVTKRTESRRVTVQCDYGSNDELWDEYLYTVKNLPGVS